MREASSLLQKNIKWGDILACFGGDEPILALPKTNCDGARVLAERIRAGIAGIRVKQESPTILLTASIGITGHEGKSTEISLTLLDSLIRQADQALYEGKKRGRNWVYLYERGEGNQSVVVPARSAKLPPKLH